MLTATSVKVVGGPTGDYVGVTGATGPAAAPVTGPTGMAGLTGFPGLTGHAGLAGMMSLLAGMGGATGPLGPIGYDGPRGPHGPPGPVPEGRFAVFENRQGLVGLRNSGSYIGCKFRYIPKRGGPLVYMFTGLASNTTDRIISIEAAGGRDSAPDAGSPGFGVGSRGPSIIAMNCTIPFFIVRGPDFGRIYPEFIGQNFWFDLVARCGTSSFDPIGGAITDITCIVLEF